MFLSLIITTTGSILSGLLAGFKAGDDPDLYPDTARGIWGLIIAGYACIHSVNNCCRVVYDSHGLWAAVCFIPIAAMLQFWQVFALIFGLSPFSGFIALTAIDYSEHFVALMYWLYKIFSANTEDDGFNKKRAWYGVGGVVCQ